MDETLVILLIIVLIGAPVVNSQRQTSDEKKKECAYLNNVRANFTFCCQYPVMVIWTWAFELCSQECFGTPSYHMQCCVLTCNYLYLGVVEYVSDTSDLTKVSYKGLVYSFLLSVGNDTRWTSTLESAAKTCIEQFDGANEGYDCEIIPKELGSIIGCCYNENYIRCPTFKSTPACRDTMKYVKTCMRGDG